MPLQYSHDKEPWEVTFDSPSERLDSRQEIVKSHQKRHREDYLLRFLMWTIFFGALALIFFQSIYT